MSDENFDPFDDAANTTVDTDAPDDLFEGDAFDDLLAEVDFAETESGEEIQVRDLVPAYESPYDVGLENKMWIPVRIETAHVDKQHVPRMNSKACIAVKDGKPVAIEFDKVEAALKGGATEVIREFPLPHFVATATHAAPRFGRRRFDYEIAVPVVVIKTAIFKPRPGNPKTGFPNDDGRSLRMATGATSKGDKVTRENMDEIAARMVGTIVMAQVSISRSKKSRPKNILDENKQPISVLLDPETGRAMRVFKGDAQEGHEAPYIIDGPTGEIWTGNEKLLYKIDDRFYAIRDTGESSGPLQVEYFPYNDYINPPFLPVPERKVEVLRLDNTKAEGEITMDTIGVIARQKSAADVVDILLRTGEIISATWLGTEWVERPSETNDADGGMHEFSGNEADKALASL